jgi:hypothetical protein
MTRANDLQIGGAHYRAQGDKIQHWDLAVMYQWDPFQYQITKYVMRWKNKHSTFEERLTDLKKARHFLDKYIEEAEKYDRSSESDEHFVCTAPGRYVCRRCGVIEQATDLSNAFLEHGDCPGRGYVAQG